MLILSCKYAASCELCICYIGKDQQLPLTWRQEVAYETFENRKNRLFLVSWADWTDSLKRTGIPITPCLSFICTFWTGVVQHLSKIFNDLNNISLIKHYCLWLYHILNVIDLCCIHIKDFIDEKNGQDISVHPHHFSLLDSPLFHSSTFR